MQRDIYYTLVVGGVVRRFDSKTQARRKWQRMGKPQDNKPQGWNFKLHLSQFEVQRKFEERCAEDRKKEAERMAKLMEKQQRKETLDSRVAR